MLMRSNAVWECTKIISTYILQDIAWTCTFVAEHSKTSDHGSLTQIDVQLLSWFIMESNKVSPASTYQASSHNTHD